ncbi:rab proteins geranylgeranyltransferase component A 1 [Oreochromis aureus]|uniref:Rab proteins geranylgeranyltransferase component A n=1 Tax=Oreochromis aureus TaxID=47969 RepID=A0A668UD88_OREAU|nr:rab proteins geranylgeranyltransferase component A 1 [Oreochromis aureus]XP_031597723.1 rab proteins geranylgeranyltransferase component A 1 [Oreochromis aureus]
MAAEDLPSEFDVVILGTGLAESVVAAACSRVGQRVLHVDRRSYYAANWASFTFNALLTWIQEIQAESLSEEVQDRSSLVEEGEELIYLSGSDSASISNLQVFCYVSEEAEEEEEPANTTEEEEAGAAGEGAAKEPSETESAGSKEEEAGEAAEGDEQAAQEQGEEPEADQPQPSAPPSQSEPTRKKISYTQLVKEGRRFNIDLVSKLMYSRGSLVDLLIKSNVSRYAEFKNVTRILTYRHGSVEQVPCSRADVFASRQLSVVEKRKLMRFLTSCVEETEEHQAYNGRPYLEFLREQQLGDNLQHFLLHSIAMVTEDTLTEVGLASTRHFLRCLGRYGNTPFLFPVYGLGEIPQCFCRMSAVFGGIYCLRHSVSCLIVDKDSNRCKAVIDSRGQRISCSHFVVEDGFVGADRKVATPTRLLSRAVLITDASVLPGDSEQQVSLVTVPPTDGRPAVNMVELSPSTMTCIPGTYLVHLTCQSVGSAYEDLSPVVTRMFCTAECQDQENRPAVLWCLYFNMADGSGVEPEGHDLPSNVYVCSGPDGALGHEHAIKQAESIFLKILPEEEFCPPAPNPEDIIYDGENTSPTSIGEEEEEEGLTAAGGEGEEKQQEQQEEETSLQPEE